MKEIKFSSNQKELNDFVLSVNDIPKGNDIKNLRAYSGVNHNNPLLLDVSQFNDTGVVFVKVDIKPRLIVFLEFNGRENDIRSDVWSNFGEVK